MNKIYSIIIICILAVICMGVYFQDGYKLGYDSFYHFANSMALRDSISKENLLGTKIVDGIGNDFGYGKNYFYAPLAHTMVAYIDFIVDNIVYSMKLYNILTVIVSALAMYFLAYKLSKSHKLSILSSVIYTAYPYHLSNIMIRDSLAETTTFMFIPLILLAIYELFNKEYNKCFIWFVIGYTGLILSHLVITVYFTIFVMFLLILNYKKVINKKSIICLSLASISILLITSSFWVPLLEAKTYTDYEVFEKEAMVIGIENYAVSLNDLNPFYMGNYVSVRKFIPTSVFGLTLVGIILWIYDKIKRIKNKDKIFNKIKLSNILKNTNTRIYISTFILMIIALFMTTKLFPWKDVPEFLSFIQFPWRLNIFIALFIALILPFTIKVLINKNNKICNLIFITTLVLLCFEANLYFYSLHNIQHYIIEEGIELNSGMGYQKEYLPVKTHKNYEYFENRSKDIVVLNNENENGKDIKISILEDKNNILKFNVNNLTEATLIEFPKLAYIGYTLKDSNNNEILTYEGDNGFLVANINTNGTYTLEHTGTLLNKIVNSVSFITIVLFIVYLVYYLAKNHKEIIKNLNFKGDDIIKSSNLKLSNIKNKIYEIFITNKFLIFLIITIAFFGLFINMQYALDTYSVFSGELDSILTHIASCGRFVTVVFLYILMGILQLNESYIHLISFIVGIVSITIAMYKVYKIFKTDSDKNIKNDILNILLLIVATVLIVINIFSIELFMYIEKGIMVASVMFSVLAFEQFTKCFNNKKCLLNILLAMGYMFLANCSYQGAVGIFAVLSFIYIAKNCKSFKDFIFKNLIIASIYVIPALTNLTIIKMFFNNSRVGGEVDFLQSVTKVIQNTKNMIAYTYNIIPEYMLFISVCIISLITVIYILKDKIKITNKISSLCGMCYIGIATILITIMPYLMQNTNSIWFVPRSSYSYASILGAILMYLIIKYNLSNKFKIFILGLSSIIFIMQIISFTNLVIDNNIINYKDKEVTYEIIKLIQEYEIENKITIDKISIYYDEAPSYTYDGMQTIGDVNTKALFPEWSAKAIIEYFSGKTLVTEVNDEILKKQFASENYYEFNEKQVVFKDNTIHICLY